MNNKGKTEANWDDRLPVWAELEKWDESLPEWTELGKWDLSEFGWYEKE